MSRLVVLSQKDLDRMLRGVAKKGIDEGRQAYKTAFDDKTSELESEQIDSYIKLLMTLYAAVTQQQRVLHRALTEILALAEPYTEADDES